MKAIVQHRYGSTDQLAFTEIDTPVPGDGEILIRVAASSVNSYDLHFLRGEPLLARVIGGGSGVGLRRPRAMVRGRDVAGVVEAVGAGVTAFAPGDEVYSETTSGGFAEYAIAPAALAAPKPANLTFEEAAAVPLAGLTALQGLRDAGHLRAGQSVLINGASGGVGTFAVQIAKALGADVTGVCSTRNVDLVRSLGADHVIDYTRSDFARAGQRYDVVLDLVANRKLADLRRALAPEGILVLSGGTGSRLLGPFPLTVNALLRARFTKQTLTLLVWKPNSADLAALTELIESGKVAPSIERVYPLSKAAEALRQVEEEHARAKIVITV